MNTCDGGKGWSAPLPGRQRRSASPLDVEQLVESRVLEDVVDVVADLDQAQLPARGHQPLVGAQQDPESRAGDVFEAGHVDRARVGQRVEEGLRLRAWGTADRPVKA